MVSATVERALRQLLEAREVRRRASQPAPGGLLGSTDDWRTTALTDLADGILFIARKNWLLQDEIRALREEVRRLRGRRSAA